MRRWKESPSKRFDASFTSGPLSPKFGSGSRNVRKLPHHADRERQPSHRRVVRGVAADLVARAVALDQLLDLVEDRLRVVVAHVRAEADVAEAAGGDLDAVERRAVGDVVAVHEEVE